MKPSTSRSLLAASFLIGAVALAATATAQTTGKGDNSSNNKRDRADFVRGNDNTKRQRVVLPKTEKEAIANMRRVEPGIIEMQLPEDRMVNLVPVRNADGSMGFEHVAEGQSPPVKLPQGEVK